jgi:hypothetical protein
VATIQIRRINDLSIFILVIYILRLYFNNFAGVESVEVDKDKKMTLVGDTDPVLVVAKLRKLCHAEILSVGPAKEEKKDEPKKDDKKKEDDKKDSPMIINPFVLYGTPTTYYNHQMNPYNSYYRAVSVEEEPNGCVII